MSALRCGQCGNVSPPGTAVCPNCGAGLGPARVAPSGPSGFRVVINLLGGTAFLVGAIALYLWAQSHAPEKFPGYQPCAALLCTIRERPDDWYFSADGLLKVTLLAAVIGVGSALGLAQTLILQARASR